MRESTKDMDIYTKTRDLLRMISDEHLRLAFGANRVSAVVHGDVHGLAIRLKASRAIRRCLDFAICILGPNYITKEEHPSRFYRSIFGKSLLCLFQPILRFRKLLLSFEIFIYAGYFGKISREHYNLLKPHPDYIEKTQHCLAPE